MLQLYEERGILAQTVIEREQDVEEHNLVIKTLEAQDGSKKAWRLVGDVLVERTVSEVVPDIIKNRDNLLAVIGNLRKQLEAKQKEVAAFEGKYNVRMKNQGGNGGGNASGSGSKADGGAGTSSGQGVLVSDT